MSVVSTLFTEQLRPQTLDQALLVDRVRNQLQNELNSENGIISNLLFFGSQGAGKCLSYDEELSIYVSDDLKEKLEKFLEIK